MTYVRLLVIIYAVINSISSNAFDVSNFITNQEYDVLTNLNIINCQRKTHGIIHEKFFLMFMNDLMKDDEIRDYKESGLLTEAMYQADWLLMLYLIKKPLLTLDMFHKEYSKKLILAYASAVIIVLKYHCDDAMYINEILNSVNLLHEKPITLKDLKKAEVNFLNTINWNLRILYNCNDRKQN